MKDREGRYLKIVTHADRDHFCRLPGWIERWRNDVADGTIWQCDCGHKWEWHEGTQRGTWRRLPPELPGLLAGR